MKLTLQEISYLRKEARRLREREEAYYEYMKSREIKSPTGQEIQSISDVLTEGAFYREFENYHSIIELLTNSEYITQPSTETIGIGTKFVVTYDSDEDEDTLVLTESGYGYSENESIVTTDSPLGQVIQGKKAGESFEFTLGNDIRMSLERRTIKGKIKEIKTEEASQIRFIKDRDCYSRMSKKARKTIHELLNSPDEEAQATLESLEEISPSQKELIQIEIKRIEKEPKTTSNIQKLAYLRKIYQSAKVAEPVYDGTIGIGTTFEIMTTDGETVTTHEYELINKAVSSEIETDYIERISPMGEKIFGLKENDEFEFIKNHQKHKGIITRVDVPERKIGMAYQKKL